MLPIVCFVGRSGSGKTTVIEGLVGELVRRGRRVGAVKHAHQGFELGPDHKDSQRLAGAGASPVLLLAPDRYALVACTPAELPLSELLPLLLQCDVVLAEGFKGSGYLKVEVHRRELGDTLLLPPESLSAVVSDSPVEAAVPRFSFAEVALLADWVESACTAAQEELAVHLTVNGQPVGLNPFATRILGLVVLGAVSALKGAEAPRTVQISVRRAAV